VHASRLVVLAGIVAVLVGALLPWASVDGRSFSGIETLDGYYSVGMALLMLVLVVVGDRAAGLGTARALVVLVLGATAAGLVILNLTKLAEGIEAELGLYLTLVGGAIAGAGALLGVRR
jgi:hypothetical protein